MNSIGSWGQIARVEFILLVLSFRFDVQIALLAVIATSGIEMNLSAVGDRDVRG